MEEVHDAIIAHGVIFFRDQKIDFASHERFIRYFGEPHVHVGGAGTASTIVPDHPAIRKQYFDKSSKRVSGEEWHSDQSCAEIPPMYSVLYQEIVPPDGGGDTMFASAYKAYEELSPSMKVYLDGKTALHEGTRAFDKNADTYPTAIHPVVVRHPESGRKLLFVNRDFTSHIVEVPAAESRAILEFLYHALPLDTAFDRDVGQPLHPAFRDLGLLAQCPLRLPHVHKGHQAAGRGMSADGARLSAFPKDQAEIVGRHRHGLGQRKAVTGRERHHIVKLADAPGGILGLQPFVERLVGRRGVPAADLVGTVEIKEAAGPQDTRGTGDQTLTDCPRRDVYHVAADHGVDALDWPLRCRHVETKRREQVRQTGIGAVRGGAGQRLRIRITRLPAELRQLRRKIGDMLARAARDFEHQPRRRQHAAEHVEDGIAIARNMRTILARIGILGHAVNFRTRSLQ